jgi:Fe-S-cluster containining protein
MEKFSFRTDQLERAPKSREILRRILSKTDCLTCGICCSSSQKKHITAVLGIDPYRRNLRQIAEDKGFEIDNAPQIGGFFVLREDRCAFLEIEEDKKLCSVYNIRPFVCLTFPFIIQTMKKISLEHGDMGSVDIPMLTTACPPLEEAKAQGVNYVAMDEIIGSTIIDGRKVLVGIMPILGEVFLNVIGTTGWCRLFDLEKILKINGREIFPIG